MKTYSIEYFHKESLKIQNNSIHIPLITIDTSRKPAKAISLQLDTGAFITTMPKNEAVDNGYKVIEENGCVISGFSEKGLLCDLRVIPVLVFCGFAIENAIFATPHDDNVKIASVLGMNILENFDLGLNFTNNEIFVAVRSNFISQKPKYQSGAVHLLEESQYKNF
ncbi:MAG: hypothetical protein FWG64_10725 [Firmicutes bacterium]|nr:hypothetical protein [Bacillota bacterium]